MECIYSNESVWCAHMLKVCDPPLVFNLLLAKPFFSGQAFWWPQNLLILLLLLTLSDCFPAFFKKVSTNRNKDKEHQLSSLAFTSPLGGRVQISHKNRERQTCDKDSKIKWGGGTSWRKVIDNVLHPPPTKQRSSQLHILAFFRGCSSICWIQTLLDQSCWAFHICYHSFLGNRYLEGTRLGRAGMWTQ